MRRREAAGPAVIPPDGCGGTGAVRVMRTLSLLRVAGNGRYGPGTCAGRHMRAAGAVRRESSVESKRSPSAEVHSNGVRCGRWLVADIVPSSVRHRQTNCPDWVNRRRVGGDAPSQRWHRHLPVCLPLGASLVGSACLYGASIGRRCRINVHRRPRPRTSQIHVAFADAVYPHLTSVLGASELAPGFPA